MPAPVFTLNGTVGFFVSGIARRTMSGIIHNGIKNYRRALDEEERELLHKLRVEMNKEKNPLELADLEKKVEKLQREYREKRKNSRWCLFSKP